MHPSAFLCEPFPSAAKIRAFLAEGNSLEGLNTSLRLGPYVTDSADEAAHLILSSFRTADGLEIPVADDFSKREP